MTAQTAYQFLRPSLEQLTQEEKDELCKLISGEPKPKPVQVKKKMKDPVHSSEYYGKRLLETVFNKNKKATRQGGSK